VIFFSVSGWVQRLVRQRILDATQAQPEQLPPGKSPPSRKLFAPRELPPLAPNLTASAGGAAVKFQVSSWLLTGTLNTKVIV